MKENRNKGEKERALPGAGTVLTTMVPKLLTVAEVAKVLAVSVRTVRDYLARGKLRGVHLPERLIRVKEAELARFIEDCEDPY